MEKYTAIRIIWLGHSPIKHILIVIFLFKINIKLSELSA